MKRVVFAVIPPIQILDLTGPFEVFARAGGYRVELVSSERASAVRSSSGLSVTGARRYRSVRGPIDTLLVPGGEGTEDLRCDGAFLEWLARRSTTVRRIGSICTGVFALAAAGVLDGRRATTHWAWCDRLARGYPGIVVEPDSIFVKDGHVYSSAGVTAGIDLALALLEEDHGRQKVRTVARDLVMYLQRAGGQSQFSSFLARPEPAREPIESLKLWIPDHLREDLSVEALAERCAMSPRHFARVFAAETGVTPARFIERMRVSAAQSLLEEAAVSMKEIAARCGFGSGDSMRRAFARTLAVTPFEYAERHGAQR